MNPSLNLSRGSKKGACCLWGFWFFFSKKPQILKIQVCFFSTYKCFWNFLPKYSELSYIKLIMTEISRNLRNIFFGKYPRFWNLKSDFFPIEKLFRRFSKIRKIYMLWTTSDKILSKIREPFWNPSTIHHPYVTLKKYRGKKKGRYQLKIEIKKLLLGG